MEGENNTTHDETALIYVKFICIMGDDIAQYETGAMHIVYVTITYREDTHLSLWCFSLYHVKEPAAISSDSDTNSETLIKYFSLI